MSESSICFLLIHGFTGAHHEMVPLAEFLREQGYSFKNITLPGHETSVDDLSKTKWTEWIDFAQSELDILKEKFERVYVCGLSMGGAITLLLGSRNRDLAGIIPLAAVHKVPDWRMYLIIGVPFLGLIYPNHKNEERGWEDLDALSTHESYGYYPIKAIKQVYKLLRAVKKSIHEIEVPILVVNSKNDPSIPVQFGENILEAVKSTDKTLVVIEKGGHVIPKDAGRFQLFEEIKKWMKKRV